MLDITQDIQFDDRIVKSQFHSHQSYSTLTFSPSDEIKIAIRQEDISTLPCESYLYLEGSLVKEDGTVPTKATFINNGFAFLFEEIRYEIGGVEIDRTRLCGITSTLKSYCSFSAEEVKNLEHTGWFSSESSPLVNTSNGNFSAILPLKYLMGFFEDYNKLIVQMKQELILTRSKTDINAIFLSESETTKDYRFSLSKVSWHVPYVTLSDEEKIRLYKVINNDVVISAAFRTWEIFEMPLLPKTSIYNWNVKTSAGLERPRYVIVAFQTGRKDIISRDMSKFDHCNVRSVRVWLNSEYYPYQLENIDFAKNNHVIFYDQYLRFKTSYYGEQTLSMLSFSEYTAKAPIFVIDCSKQSENIKSNNIDIRIEIQASKDFPEKTSAYALIINDRIIEYTPSKNLVRKI